MIKYYNLVKPWSRWLFLLMFLFSLQSKALTQDSIQVSINAVNKPIEVVFKQIENQTGYTVFYGRPTLNGDEMVTLQTRGSLSSIMNTLMKGRNIAWALKDKSIILTKRAVVGENGNSNLDTVPKVNISGSIVDKSGIPVVGATVSLRGQGMGQATDNLGRFRFANVPDNSTLVVSSVGYKPKQVRLGGETEFKIFLDSAITDIQKIEVVSTGYQVIAKERVTGSFFLVENKVFNRSVGATVLDRIRNLVPGVYSKVGAADPLDNFTIRGVSTINANKQPLLVVDNFIYDGDPNSLNPNDVESITILRDAAAASIWGVRAGNGVIVVTMKKGRFTNKPLVSFNTNFSFVKKPELSALPSIPSKSIIELEKKRFAAGYFDGTLNNAFSFPVLSQVVEILAKRRSGAISESEAAAQISLLENHDVRDDIDKYLLQTAIAQQYALNVSGGGENYQYYGSIGYDRNRPNNININNERLTIRFNNTWQPIKRIQVKAEINWGQSNGRSHNSLGSGSYNNLLTAPYNRLADINGNATALPTKYRMNYVDTVRFPGQLDWHYYPLDEANNGDFSSRSYNTRINTGINYSVMPGLRLDVNYQWQKVLSDNKTINGIATFSTRDLINSFATVGPNGLVVYPYPLGGVYNKSNSDQTAWNLRGLLNFDKSYKQHDISLMIGLETREVKTESWVMPAQFGYISQTGTFGALRLGEWISRPGQFTQILSAGVASTRGTINRFGSSFGNIAYTYDSKYAVSGSARIDQSNFFGVKANDRKVPLWSAGVAWSVSKEEFYNIEWLPDLKLRATLGYSGNVNAGTSPFATAGYLNPVTPLFVPYAQLLTSPNPQLRWERVQNVNLGLDFGSIYQRISGNIEFFKKKGIDLISSINVDPTSGFTSYTGNNSSIQTQGFDLSLTSRNFDKKFKWYSTIIFAYQSDKVIAYSVKPPDLGQTTSIIIGKPLSNIYSYRWAGLNPKDGDAQFYLDNQVVSSVNINKVKQGDMVYNGQTTPPLFGALRNDLSYKSFSLSFNITYQLGYYFRRASFEGFLGSTSGIELWQHKDYMNAWKVPGDEKTTNVPGFLDSYMDSRYNIYKESDILIEKGDHIRLEDIRIDYELVKNTIKRMPFSKVSLYLYITNIGFLWKASHYNPDTRDDVRSVPRQKSLAIGMNMSF
ncbi:SusC/RagA family TonB-linked outer membrane protein [Chitinophaga sp. SYP-B3965]|uniref:SusC/RagA family TonB-linked outer membrane protein n=1 Tax=Chitinophaga sp. SYP-B3965 TaxID=2663120 RepID=UPI00129956A6|nr:SusC/RagA family TonB-linked outer membrane protein [Chitinophaga sp. SYP-B3965]MRG46969.1 SusC/RagA family TonB-linked outer membrane protein [Chitinophaga sp. SYP-B3965]